MAPHLRKRQIENLAEKCQVSPPYKSSRAFLRFLQETAQDEGDMKASEYAQGMVQNTLTLQRLDKALAFGRNLPTAQ